MAKNVFRKGMIIGIILLFTGASYFPNINADVVGDLDPESLPLIPMGAPANCGYEDFESGTDGKQIVSTLPGLKFTTTNGYDWIYGDWRTNQYNGRYPNGAYTSQGNIFAWLGPQQSSGKIDFTLGDASYFSCYVSTYSGAVIDAYKDDGTFICSSGWASSNINTGKMTLLSVRTESPEPDIGYVIIHDTGNYWCIDRVVCDAPGVGTSQHPVVKVKISSNKISEEIDDLYHVDVTLINIGEDSIVNDVKDNGLHVQIIGGTVDIEDIDKDEFDEMESFKGEPYSEYTAIQFYKKDIKYNTQYHGHFIVKSNNLQNDMNDEQTVIGIRGWITDKDETDKTKNPYTNQYEYYIARSPLEGKNPPSTSYDYINMPCTLHEPYVNNVDFPGFSRLDYAMYYYPLYGRNYFNSNENSIWVYTPLIFKRGSELTSFLDNLRHHSINEIYLLIGGFDINGDFYHKSEYDYDTIIKPNFNDFLIEINEYNNEHYCNFKVFPWIIGDPNGIVDEETGAIYYKYDISNEVVKQKVINFCDKFINDVPNANGIHFDYEFYYNSDMNYREPYYNLLEGVKNKIGNTKSLSVAICPSWLVWDSINYPSTSFKFVRDIAETSEEIVLMAYIVERNYESFAEWVQDETCIMFEQVNLEPQLDTRPKIGISLVDYENQDIGERFDYGLVGALMGVKKYGNPTVDFAIWAEEWADDWEWYILNAIWNPRRQVDVYIFSPADLHLYDSLGRHVGVNYDTGLVENEIPGAYYSGPDAEPQKISIPNPEDDDYQIVLIGTDNGEYHLKIEGFISDTMVHSELIEGEIVMGEIIPYSIQIPGNNPFQLIVSESFIESTIDIDPDTLNLNSSGNWITCYIELPEGYDIEDINISTILLNDVVPAETHPTSISDYDNDDIPDLMVKFDRQDVQNILELGDNVEITVTGELIDGTRFEGTDYIRVI